MVKMFNQGLSFGLSLQLQLWQPVRFSLNAMFWMLRCFHSSRGDAGTLTNLTFKCDVCDDESFNATLATLRCLSPPFNTPGDQWHVHYKQTNVQPTKQLGVLTMDYLASSAVNLGQWFWFVDLLSELVEKWESLDVAPDREILVMVWPPWWTTASRQKKGKPTFALGGQAQEKQRQPIIYCMAITRIGRTEPSWLLQEGCLISLPTSKPTVNPQMQCLVWRESFVRHLYSIRRRNILLRERSSGIFCLACVAWLMAVLLQVSNPP